MVTEIITEEIKSRVLALTEWECFFLKSQRKYYDLIKDDLDTLLDGNGYVEIAKRREGIVVIKRIKVETRGKKGSSLEWHKSNEIFEKLGAGEIMRVEGVSPKPILTRLKELCRKQGRNASYRYKTVAPETYEFRRSGADLEEMRSHPEWAQEWQDGAAGFDLEGD